MKGDGEGQGHEIGGGQGLMTGISMGREIETEIVIGTVIEIDMSGKKLFPVKIRACILQINVVLVTASVLLKWVFFGMISIISNVH